MNPKQLPPTKGPADGQPLAKRVVTGPKVASPETAQALLRRDLEPALPQLSSLFSEHPAVKTLIEGIVESSPYLWDLIRADPGRLASLLTADPEQHFVSLL